MSCVLLTDPEQRACLAAARALARAGHRVMTIGARRGLAGRSRSVSRHTTVPAEQVASPDAFAARVALAVSSHAVDVIIPVTDAASTSLLGRDSELGAPVAGPSRAAFERASDKDGLLALAIRCGISVPVQHVVQHPDAFDALGSALQTPLVIKPARSIVQVNGVNARQSVRFASTEAEARAIVRGYPSAAFPLLLQERTIGDGIGVFLLRSRGHTTLRFGHRRLREKPPSGGVSTYREAIVPPDDLVMRCEALLDALAYDGAAMIEFKQDRVSGRYVLMEINARLWGSLQLALDAGLDFPSALVALATGKEQPPSGALRYGTRSYWELGEVDHALALLRRSREELHAPPGMKVGAMAALRVLFDRRLSDRPEVFRWSDPIPFLSELLHWVRPR